MKTRLTVFLLIVCVFSSFLYSQKPLNKRAALAKQSASLSLNGLPESFKAKTAALTKTKAPLKTASYVPGEYFIEDFESYGQLGFYDTEWQTRRITGYGWGVSSNETYTGSEAADDEEYGASEAWLATPHYSAASGDSLVFFLYSRSLAGTDTLYVLVSHSEGIPYDGDSLNAAFSDTLLTINVADITGDSKWHRFQAPLDKYAGQEIFIGFKNVTSDGSYLRMDRVKLGKAPANDLCLNSYDVKTCIISSEEISPLVEIVNNGLSYQSFHVEMDVPSAGYHEEYYIDLFPDQVMTAQLNSLYIRDAGDYDASIKIVSSEDDNPVNDTASFKISVHDMLPDLGWNSYETFPFSVNGQGTGSYSVYDKDPETLDTNFVFLLGGIKDGSEYNDKVYRYNDIDRVWTELGVMPEVRSNFSAVQIKEKLYVFGGTGQYASLSNTLYVYDMKNDSWKQGANMPTGVWGYSAAAFADSLIYVFGGVDNDDIRNLVQVYNVNTDTWTVAAPLSEPRMISSCVIAGNKIILAGGRDDENDYDEVKIGTIDINNPLNIIWTSEKFPAGWTMNMCSGLWYGKKYKYAFFVGGISEKISGNKTVWAYDLQNEKWFRVQDAPNNISGMPNLVPAYANGFINMVAAGGSSKGNYWLWIGEDEPLDVAGTDAAVKSSNIVAKYPLNEGQTFKVTFANNKLQPVTFNAVLKITPGNYSCVKTVTDLTFSETAEITFDTWTPADTGKYNITVYAETPGDMDPSNDTLKFTASVWAFAPNVAWISEKAAPKGLWYPAAATYVKKKIDGTPDTSYVYVLGGYSDGDFSDKIYKYNTLSKEWSNTTAELPEQTSNFHAAQLGGNIYIPGGYYDSGDSSLYIYDIEADTIGKGANLPFPVSMYAMGTYGDSLIYVIGGMSFYSSINTVLVYDVYTNEWKYGTPYPGTARYALGGAICGDKIILSGGRDDSNIGYTTVNIGTINPENPYEITWTEGKDMPEGARWEMSSGSWNGKERKYAIFAGGYSYNSNEDKESYYASTWIYDVENDTWLGSPDKITAADAPANMTAVVRNDSVYMAALGGYNPSSEALDVNEWLYIGPYDGPEYSSKDAAPVSVDFDTVLVNTAFTPKATFAYNRLAPEDVIVTMTITPGSYVSVDTIQALAYNGPKQVSFKTWTPDTTGTFTVKVYTSLAGDGNASNDTLTSVVIVKKLIGTENDLNNLPKEYALEQNYPNPFNPATKIKYALPKAGPVELKVYNMLGQEVATLVNEFMSAGYHEAVFNASALRLSSGVYIYRIQAGNFVQTKKLMLLK